MHAIKYCIIFCLHFTLHSACFYDNLYAILSGNGGFNKL